MKRDESVGFYQITHENGMVQKKELITVNDHIYYKSLTNRKHELDEEIAIQKRDNRKKKKPIDQALLNELKEINETLKKEFPYQFFVVNSPMYEALATGLIRVPEPAGNSGIYKMESIKISRGEM